VFDEFEQSLHEFGGLSFGVVGSTIDCLGDVSFGQGPFSVAFGVTRARIQGRPSFVITSAGRHGGVLVWGFGLSPYHTDLNWKRQGEGLGRGGLISFEALQAANPVGFENRGFLLFG